MNSSAQDRSATVRDDAAVQNGATAQDKVAAQDGAAAQATAASQGGEAPAPLTSLSSLLGGSVEGGAACAADGTCD